jgi:hypothetical protein
MDSFASFFTTASKGPEPESLTPIDSDADAGPIFAGCVVA